MTHAHTQTNVYLPGPQELAHTNMNKNKKYDRLPQTGTSV